MRAALVCMGLVLSFADARAEKIKAKLCTFAERRMRGMVETSDGLIDARRIFCRETIAVLIDRYGYQTKLRYDEITDVSAILPIADIIKFARWQVVDADEVTEETSIVSFPAPPSVDEGAAPSE